MVALRNRIHPKRAKTNIHKLIAHKDVPAVEELFAAIMLLIATH